MKRILSLLMALVLLISLVPVLPAHAHAEEDHPAQSFTKLTDAVAWVKEMLLQRTTDLTIQIPLELYYTGLQEAIYSDAVLPTRNPKEGDTLLLQSVPYNCYASLDEKYAYLSYSFLYLTTVQEEVELDGALDALLQELGCSAEDTYGSVVKIYDWICANITRTYTPDASPQDYTAYGAMMNRKAESQGIALLVYQLLWKLGIENRVMMGYCLNEGDCWNIVRLDWEYHHLDASMDIGKTAYDYFLIGADNFRNHERMGIYNSSEFYKRYPIARPDYAPPKDPCENGHTWSDGSCTKLAVCVFCNLTTDHYGDHSFGRTDCMAENRICEECGYVGGPGSHVYDDKWDDGCNRCLKTRYAICEGEQRINLVGSREDGDVILLSGEGVTLTVLDVYSQTDYFGTYIYREYALSFPGTGSYDIQLTIENTQEIISYMVDVFPHEYYEGVCVLCKQEDENGHIPVWREATCTEPQTCDLCGETKGEPLGHDYQTGCCTEPGTCVRCGQTAQEAPGHVFEGKFAYNCEVCGQPLIHACLENGLHSGLFSSETTEDLYLVDTDPAITLTVTECSPWEDHYEIRYSLTASKLGLFEITVGQKGNETTDRFTLEILPHSYVNGRCPWCYETDGTVHYHTWENATCSAPMTCTECGATKGEKVPHLFDYWECDKSRTCELCGLTLEAPSHTYDDQYDSNCNTCLRQRITSCPVSQNGILISGYKAENFVLEEAPEGVSMSLIKAYEESGIPYAQYSITTPGIGSYDISIKQVDSERTMAFTLQILDHESMEDACLYCGELEESEHIHNWKSATCTEASVCTECGQVGGEPLGHDYRDAYCLEPARCARCGEERGATVHTYDDKKDDSCNVCGQLRLTGCMGTDLSFLVSNDDVTGFYLLDPPEGVSIERIKYYRQGMTYYHEYALTVPKAGLYELSLKVDFEPVALVFTVEIFEHEYVDGICDLCEAVDPDYHAHQWQNATCTSPRTCTLCGETDGEALAHEWRGENPKYCTRCGLEFKGILGDVDGNGKLSYNDSLLILRGSIGLAILDDAQKLLADADGNGVVNYNDALLVLRISIGLA